MAELILCGDTFNEGRIKLNEFYSGGSVLFSSSTCSTSLVTLPEDSNNIAKGEYAIAFGGNDNIISGTCSGAPYGGRYSSILGGNGNSIILGGTAQYGENSTIINSSNCSLTAGTNSFIITSLNSTICGKTSRNGIISSSNSEINTDDVTAGGGNVIVGGVNHNITYLDLITDTKSDYNLILGGRNNSIDGTEHCVILAGEYNTISGTSSVQFADNSSIISGSYCKVAHENSLALGGGAETSADLQLVIGNNTSGPSSTSNNTFRLEGSTGQGYADVGWTNGGADYAEFFEWDDDNVSNENRVGFFVSLINGNKIEIGNSNLLGIVSNKPGVVGDAQWSKWKETYLKDEWENILTEEYSVYTCILTSETNNPSQIYVNSADTKFISYPSSSKSNGIIFDGTLDDYKLTKKIQLPIMNPSYDENLAYVPREERPEWDAIGLLGKLYVRTSEEITGTNVDADENGYAVNGSTYHVLKTIKNYDGSYGIVQVLFK